MNLTQPIIVNNQLIPSASVRLNILLNVSIHENIIVATAALFSATTGAMIISFPSCFVQIESNSIYKNGITTTSAGAYNTYKAKINSSSDDFITLLGDVPIRPGDNTVNYYISA